MDDAHLTFQPLNELERLMVAAHADPAETSAFRKALRTEPLYALTQATVDGGRQLARGDRISLVVAPQESGPPAVVLFTAPARIAQVYPMGTPYIQGPGGEVLSLVRQNAALLNPGIPYGVAWSPAEIWELLEG